MATWLNSIHIQNYRLLADVELALEPVNVLFGPSGAGKSTLLDAICFVRDCQDRSVAFASAKRGQGLGLLYDRAGVGEPIRIALRTSRAEYELTLGVSLNGRIDPLVGERFRSLDQDRILLERRPGTAQVTFFGSPTTQPISVDLREPEQLVLARHFASPYANAEALFAVAVLSARHYHSRSMKLAELKRLGSAAGFDSYVTEDGENLWSVLRTLDGLRLLDDRYATIMRYMTEAFPSFKGLITVATAPTVVYARFLESDRAKPIDASGISDGHLQFLILLTILFCQGPDGPPLIMIDEPETSLHPWALAVLANAIREATEKWGRQVILATHSPVLMSQFEPNELLAVESNEGRTRITRLSDMADIQDLLQDYAAGSLYMSGVVAPQNKPPEVPSVGR
jgi:predicted ATPase